MYAVVQYKPRRGARNSNLAALATLAAQALQGGAKVLVLPEMAATGYRFPNPEAIRPMSEAPRGPTYRTFAPLARQYRAHVVVGFVEDHEGRLFNSALVINAAGQLEALYRKRLLYIDDHTWASPGDLPYPQFTTPYGTATVGICMDINDPRFITHIRRTQPAMVCFPTNWVDEGIDIQKYWANQLRGWNGTLVAADRWGEEDGVGFAGRSAVMRRGETVVSGPAEGDGWWGAPFVREPGAAPVPKKVAVVVPVATAPVAAAQVDAAQVDAAQVDAAPEAPLPVRTPAGE